MAHFYLAPELAETTVGATVVLSGSEGRHAATVSRVRVGESLRIGNGRGLVAVAEVVATTKDTVEVSVRDVTIFEPLKPSITLVQALAKTDRDERAIEAATELGISAVMPWAADRSVSKWEGPKVAKGHLRWSSIVHEATKQCIRPFIPEVLPLSTTKAAIAALDHAQIIVLDPTGEISLSDVELNGGNEIALVVGPEGGITAGELDAFRAAGATIVTLGSNILRTSTAGPAALAVLGAKLGRW